MGSSSYECGNTTNYEPKLCLSSLPNRLKTAKAELAMTPPIQTLATVPFKWEEAPGKPIIIPKTTNTPNDVVFRPKSKAVRCLHLPADSLTTTVLDGPPCLSRSHSLASTASFGRPKGHRGSSLFGSSSSTRWNSDNNGGVDFCSAKVNIVRISRKSSFFSFSPSTSFFLTNIYESLKQVVPWRRRHTTSQP